MAVKPWLTATALTLGLSLPVVAAPEIKTRESNGPPASKIDLVFVSDGYSIGDKAAFYRQVDVACNYLWGTQFFRDFRSSFNIHTYFVPAERTTSGVVFPFGSYYTDEAVGRTAIRKTQELEQAAAQAPGADIIVLLTTLKGTSTGGRHIILTGGDAAAFPHEMGHRLGDLGDEYDSRSRTADREYFPLPTTGDLNYANLTLFKEPLKWKHFLDLPDGKDVVGTYEGGYYRGGGVYRPSYRCIMRVSSDGMFCPVCHEEMARKVSAACRQPFDHNAYHRRFPLKNWKGGLKY